MRPQLVNNSVQITKGTGYWDLTHYPWGGSFRRFPADCTATLSRVINTYSNNSPRDIVATIDGKQIGITL